MKTLNIAEIDESLAESEGVILLEKDGQAVAAVIPMAEYEAFRAWQEAEARRQAHEAQQAAIEREHAAYERMLPDLLQKYEGQAVAIYQGQVVGVGEAEQKMYLWAQMREKFGPVPIYVQVVEYPPRVYEVFSL